MQFKLNDTDGRQGVDYTSLITGTLISQLKRVWLKMAPHQSRANEDHDTPIVGHRNVVAEIETTPTVTAGTLL